MRENWELRAGKLERNMLNESRVLYVGGFGPTRNYSPPSVAGRRPLNVQQLILRDQLRKEDQHYR